MRMAVSHLRVARHRAGAVRLHVVHVAARDAGLLAHLRMHVPKLALFLSPIKSPPATHDNPVPGP